MKLTTTMTDGQWFTKTKASKKLARVEFKKTIETKRHRWLANMP